MKIRNILDNPFAVSKEWLAALNEDPDEYVTPMVNYLLGNSAIAQDNHHIKLQQFEQFISSFNKLEGPETKFGDPRHQFTKKELIGFIMDFCTDVYSVSKSKDEKSQTFCYNFIIFSGLYLWLQLGVELDDVVQKAQDLDIIGKKKKKDEETVDENIIDDDLPYFGSKRRNDDENSGSKPVKRMVRKQEASNKDEKNSRAKAIIKILETLIKQISSDSINTNVARHTVLLTTLAVQVSYNKEGFFDDYYDLVKLVKRSQE